MAINKNQHFVPRCHLKPFTKDEANFCIRLYQLSKDRLVEVAPVKNQCSRDYFYGKDPDLEKWIQAVEAKYGAVSRRIQQRRRPLDFDDGTFLLNFWVLQHMRTESTQKSVINFGQATLDAIGAPVPGFLPEKAEATLFALKVCAENLMAITDLNVVILHNRTEVPFITSDNPAVMTNRWIISKVQKDTANFSMYSAGFLGFLPISPKHVAVIFDKDVYSVPHESGHCDLRQVADVASVNEHQLLNCMDAVFLSADFQVEQIRQSVGELKRLRQGAGARAIVFARKRGSADPRYFRVDEASLDATNEAMIQTSVYYPRPTGWPSVIGWRSKGFYFDNGTGLGPVRRQIAAEKATTGTRPFRRIRTGH